LYPTESTFKFFEEKLNQKDENSQNNSSSDINQGLSRSQDSQNNPDLSEKIPDKSTEEIQTIFNRSDKELKQGVVAGTAETPKPSKALLNGSNQSADQILKLVKELIDNKKLEKAIETADLSQYSGAVFFNRPDRSADQNSDFFKSLISKFPNRKGEIEQLLKTFPTETNSSFFLTKLVEDERFLTPTTSAEMLKTSFSSNSQYFVRIK
jgi:hypothetical protein